MSREHISLETEIPGLLRGNTSPTVHTEDHIFAGLGQGCACWETYITGEHISALHRFNPVQQPTESADYNHNLRTSKTIRTDVIRNACSFNNVTGSHWRAPRENHVIGAPIYDGVWLASYPGSLAHSRGGRGAKRESLVHIACACANYLGYHACTRYPRKYTEVLFIGVYKKYWNTQKCTGEPADMLDMPSVLQRTLLQAIILLGQSLAKLVAT